MRQYSLWQIKLENKPVEDSLKHRQYLIQVVKAKQASRGTAILTTMETKNGTLYGKQIWDQS